MCVQIAAKKGRPGTSQLITGVPLVTFTAGPSESDCEVPALVGTGDLPVIKGQVLGLPFLAAI